MSAAEAFVTHLLADDSVSALVGSRVMQEHVDEDDALPYIVFGRRGKVEDRTHDGTGGLAMTTFDVECRAASLSESETLAQRVDESFDNLRDQAGRRRRGLMGGNVFCQAAFVKDADEHFERFPPGSDEVEVSTRIMIELHHNT